MHITSEASDLTCFVISLNEAWHFCCLINMFRLNKFVSLSACKLFVYSMAWNISIYCQDEIIYHNTAESIGWKVINHIWELHIPHWHIHQLTVRLIWSCICSMYTHTVEYFMTNWAAKFMLNHNAWKKLHHNLY